MTERVYPPYDKIPECHTDAVRMMLEAVGYDTYSEHTRRTPDRFMRYLHHLMGPATAFRMTKFENKNPVVSEMQVVPNIPFWSACSHHLLPFVGIVHVGYIPNKYLIGLSKIPLIVRATAKGFWMQEHLAVTIADKIEEFVEPQGLAVYIQARHTCQLLDLQQPPIPLMITTVLRGILMHGGAARSEFYSLIGESRKGF